MSVALSSPEGEDTSVQDIKRQSSTAHLDCLTRKQRAFVEAMVWHGLQFKECREKANISESYAYLLLHDPLVLEAMKRERQVLKASAGTRNIHALMKVRDESRNHLAVVQAVKAIEEMTSEESVSAGSKRVGIVIMIGDQQPTRLLPDGSQAIDITPQSTERAYAEVRGTAQRGLLGAPLPDDDDDSGSA